MPTNALPANSLSKSRIESIDFLKGLVIVIMALDHTRDYFHDAVFYFDPTDPTKSTLPIFFTRWITDYCAPAFSLLAGISAYIVGKRKTPVELSTFLLKRGLWLIFVEIIVDSFAWTFDIHFTTIFLGVIWVLGLSMIVLAGLIHLPKRVILIFSVVVIFGHNLLDTVHFPGSIFWSVIHERNRFPWGVGHFLNTTYALVPWAAVMSLGYCIGELYNASFDGFKRRKILNSLGIGFVVLFVLLRELNHYGDPLPWTNYNELSKNLISFFNVNKYPPSLSYLLMTLGPVFIFLANTEKSRGWLINFFCVFGRVPFFFYIIHIYLIHVIAMLAAEMTGFGWRRMILTRFIAKMVELKGYGFSLLVVYLVWIGVILIMYPLCARFSGYKLANKKKWWLSYL